MKQVYLIRHAKSSWKNPQLTDFERPLNKRGKRDAPFMAQRMVEKGMQIDALWASPSKRTQATAQAFAAALDYPFDKIYWEQDIYEASVATLLQLVQKMKPQWNSIALFAHNFACTDWANHYATPALDNVPTTGIVQIAFEVANWAEISASNGQVLDFEYPRLYFPKK